MSFNNNELIVTNNFFAKIANIIEQSRSKVVSSVNQIMVQTYWQIGKEIVEEEQNGQYRAEYGKALIDNLAKNLSSQYGRGFSNRNLRNMRQFYLYFPIWQTASAKLSWSHYCLLIRIEEETKRLFYEVECTKNQWSVRELERQINSMLFERLALSKNKDAVKEMAKEGQILKIPEDLVKDPYVLEFLGLSQSDELYEKDLESAIIKHLQKFLLELGRGFSFVDRQKRISFDHKHFYIDLVFYNYILRCFVLIDLKIGELTHQDIGQMQMYVNYYKRELMNEGDNQPIGIILCADKAEAVVKYTLPEDNNQIFASKYMLYLPTEEELKAELLKEKALIELYQSLDTGKEFKDEQ